MLREIVDAAERGEVDGVIVLHADPYHVHIASAGEVNPRVVDDLAAAMGAESEAPS